MRTCPECGADREGAVRFCPGCGLDYWRVAAGQSAHPEPLPIRASAAAGTGSRPTRFIFAGVGLLLVAGVAIVVASGVLPPGVPGGRPLPTARPLTAEEALVHAFFREVRDPRARYTVDVEGTTTFTGITDSPPPISTSGEFRLHGDDWEGHERLVQDDETVLDVRMVLVDDVGYLSQDDGDWVSDEIPDRLQPISPFRRISTVTEVEYLEKTGEGGRPLYRLAISKWLGGRDYSDILRRFARIVSQESRMEVVVNAFGVPSVAEIVLTVVATDGRETLTITGTFTYRIGSWDAVEPIDAPAPAEGEAAAETRH